MRTVLDPLRGTGRTTNTIKNAPKDAIFIWCTDDIRWCKNLARELDREDLQIHSARSLLGQPEPFKGLRNFIVLDNAFAELNSRHTKYGPALEFVYQHNSRINLK